MPRPDRNSSDRLHGDATFGGDIDRRVAESQASAELQQRVQPFAARLANEKGGAAGFELRVCAEASDEVFEDQTGDVGDRQFQRLGKRRPAEGFEFAGWSGKLGLAEASVADSSEEAGVEAAGIVGGRDGAGEEPELRKIGA